MPSALMEFFEMSSEAWFLCLAFELAISLSDPFSTFKSRLKKYVLFACTVGVLFGSFVGAFKGVYGFWNISREFDSTVFCWLAVDNSTYVPWFLLYIPVGFVYAFSIYTMLVSYNKLREGISSTFRHRIKALVVNSANILIFVLYWVSQCAHGLPAQYFVNILDLLLCSPLGLDYYGVLHYALCSIGIKTSIQIDAIFFSRERRS